MTEVENPLPFPLPGPFYQKGVGQWGAPCPFCGQGNDRLNIWRDDNRLGGFRFWCRVCGEYGDGVDLRRKVESIGYAEACGRFGIKPRRGSGDAHRLAGDGLAWRKKKQEADSKVSPWQMPNRLWSMEAAKFLASCQAGFATDWNAQPGPYCVNESVLICERHLDLDACLKTGVGVNDQAFYARRAAWGLPAVSGRDLISIPGGIVIATKRRGVVVGVSIRRFESDTGYGKYKELPSDGAKFPFLLGNPGQPLLICEGALDAALAHGRALRLGRQLAVIALHGASKLNFDPAAMEVIAKAPKIILAYDGDESGRYAAAKLRVSLPRALIAPAGGYKDLTDLETAYFQGQSPGGVDDWLMWALDHLES